eukprot:gnl/TRDRNA2_/TRDRNA2_186601_c0_seq1.p1 gnl/TRDRNA2_/TRDRNA2_186601_c0~~gnl/TRDRNA2_/TRDRNA2_186601_c0_seq1.p1  ORF type:complete len:297 (+),score=30.53 gnl/TRDRNA2_/TRDRNA2_186601_c0_seq1:116-1006(+)
MTGQTLSHSEAQTDDLETGFHQQAKLQSGKTLKVASASAALRSFFLCDDGSDVSACVRLNLKLVPFQVTDEALPFGLKCSNREKIVEAFEPWNAYISRSYDAKLMNRGVLDEASVLMFICANMIFIFGFYCGAIDRAWIAAALMYAAGILLIVACIAIFVRNTMKAHLAFNPICEKVKELADRLQAHLAPDGINVRPICKKGASYLTCRFLLEITMPVWNRNGNTCCHTKSSDAGCEGVEPCAICLSGFEDSQLIRVLPCSHRYHAACADDWLRNSDLCPLCKRTTGRDKRCTFSA